MHGAQAENLRQSHVRSVAVGGPNAQPQEPPVHAADHSAAGPRTLIPLEVSLTPESGAAGAPAPSAAPPAANSAPLHDPNHHQLPPKERQTLQQQLPQPSQMQQQHGVGQARFQHSTQQLRPPQLQPPPPPHPQQQQRLPAPVILPPPHRPPHAASHPPGFVPGRSGEAFVAQQKAMLEAQQQSGQRPHPSPPPHHHHPFPLAGGPSGPRPSPGQAPPAARPMRQPDHQLSAGPGQHRPAALLGRNAQLPAGGGGGRQGPDAYAGAPAGALPGPLPAPAAQGPDFGDQTFAMRPAAPRTAPLPPQLAQALQSLQGKVPQLSAPPSHPHPHHLPQQQPQTSAAGGPDEYPASFSQSDGSGVRPSRFGAVPPADAPATGPQQHPHQSAQPRGGSRWDSGNAPADGPSVPRSDGLMEGRFDDGGSRAGDQFGGNRGRGAHLPIQQANFG